MAPSLEADLQPHDWLLAGTWSYVDRDPAEYTDFPQGPRADCIRYLPDGGELRLAWTPRADGSMHLHAYRLPDTTVTVERGRGRTWLVTTHGGGERQFLRVVSYAAGVLVLDAPRDGTRSSRSVDFRAVRVVMARAGQASAP